MLALLERKLRRRASVSGGTSEDCTNSCIRFASCACMCTNRVGQCILVNHTACRIN